MRSRRRWLAPCPALRTRENDPLSWVPEGSWEDASFSVHLAAGRQEEAATHLACPVCSCYLCRPGRRGFLGQSRRKEDRLLFFFLVRVAGQTEKVKVTQFFL